MGGGTSKLCFTQGVSGYVTGNPGMCRHPLDVHFMAAVGHETDEVPRGGCGIDVILKPNQTLNRAARVA